MDQKDRRRQSTRTLGKRGDGVFAMVVFLLVAITAPMLVLAGSKCVLTFIEQCILERRLRDSFAVQGAIVAILGLVVAVIGQVMELARHVAPKTPRADERDTSRTVMLSLSAMGTMTAVVAAVVTLVSLLPGS